MSQLNLALKFLLELAALAALGLYGASIAHGAAAVVLRNALLLTAFDQWEA